MKPKTDENGNLNAEFAENPQDRPTDELIRKQDAIAATMETVFVEYEDTDPRKEESIILQTKAAIRDRIKALPPVQPDVPVINVGDMISRRAAIDALDVLCQEHRYKIPGKVETYSQYNEAWQDALDRAEGAIGNLPSAQPNHNAEVGKMEIIHCKDCKYASDDDYCHCKYVTWWNGPDDYCSRAEKRGEAE